MLVKSFKRLAISTYIGVISFLEAVFQEEDIMRNVICPICGSICSKYGKTKANSQRWFCKKCNMAFSPKIDNSTKQLKVFLKWLFGKGTQKNMPGEGRTFRRNTAQFWNIWTLPPVVETKREVSYVDGIYLCRHACILICCDDKHVLGWYLCRYEHSAAWFALLSRIKEPELVVSDGGSGFAKALKKTWPHAKHQRCVFHAFSQIKRYTTTCPKTLAGIELYMLAKDLLYVDSKEKSVHWVDRFVEWMAKYNLFLSQMTYDEFGNARPKHDRLIKAQNSIVRLLKDGTLFTYLDDSLKQSIDNIPSTTNRIEGGINSQLRGMLREHRGLSIERRIKAVFWWCYMHSPDPLSASEILKIMPTDKSIADICQRLIDAEKQVASIPRWGDAVVWNEFHTSTNYPVYWD